MAKKEIPRELPSEIWEKVLSNYLDNPRYLEPLSLVSKQFLTLTNSLRTTLSLTHPATQFLSSLFLRFKTLNSIDLSSFRGDPTSVLLQIPRYYPHLRSLNLSNQKSLPLDAFREIGYRLKSLKVLTLSNLGVLDDNDLVFVADCFPNLEELDISFPQKSQSHHSSSSFVTGAGISALSLKLKNLKRIDISGNYYVWDTGIIDLSINCVFLKWIAIKECYGVSPNAIDRLLKNSQHLEALFLDGGLLRFSYGAISFEFASCLVFLDLSHLFVPDEWLFSIGKGRFPLKALFLSYSRGFSTEGLSSILRKHRGIEHLELRNLECLTDNDISMLSEFLSELVMIDLSLCKKLTAMAFHYLTQACPLLKEIKMGAINMLEEEEDSSMHSGINSQVRSLHLPNNDLSDRCLEKYVELWPNLRYLNVSFCQKLSEEAVLLVMKRCNEIKHLEINGCTQIKNLDIDFDVPSLEVLRAQKTELNGEALAAIGKRCRNLRHLDLADCINVPIDGVKAIVANCEELRVINVRCPWLNADIVSWMVLSRPSLRKIIPPYGFIPSESQRNFYLRRGCVVEEQ